MQQCDLWQEWNNYLLSRAEHISQEIAALCLENNTRLFQLFQEEFSRGLYEWNCLQFQKMASDWGNMFTVPGMCVVRK